MPSCRASPCAVTAGARSAAGDGRQQRRRQVGVERRLPPGRQELRPQPQWRRIRRQQGLQQAGGGGEGVPARLRRARQRHLARRPARRPHPKPDPRRAARPCSMPTGQLTLGRLNSAVRCLNNRSPYIATRPDLRDNSPPAAIRSGRTTAARLRETTIVTTGVALVLLGVTV